MEPDILGDVRVEPLWCVCCSDYVTLEVSVRPGFWPFLWADVLAFSEILITCAFIFVIPACIHSFIPACIHFVTPAFKACPSGVLLQPLLLQ